MDNEIKGITVMILSMTVGILLLLWLLTWCEYKWDLNVTEANMIDIYDGNMKIYEGKQAYIKVESGGMTTHLTIYRNLYPEIVSRVYSSNKIRIQPHQEN